MITIGADVEGFVKKGSHIISAIGLIGGSKDVPLLVDNGNLQEDNVLAEFAINPTKSEDEFVHHITSVMDQLKLKLATGGMEYVVQASHMMPAAELNHPKALQFGCDPDFDAWSGFPNRAPSPHEVGALRTAGGHIHLGYDKDTEDYGTARNLVMWLDVMLGIPSVILDKDKNRRKVYGKPGAFRKKPYGLEYRVLSNFWIADEKLMRWAYRQALAAYEISTQRNAFVELDEKLITNTISVGDEAAAISLIGKYNINMPEAA